MKSLGVQGVAGLVAMARIAVGQFVSLPSGCYLEEAIVVDGTTISRMTIPTFTDSSTSSGIAASSSDRTIDQEPTGGMTSASTFFGSMSSVVPVSTPRDGSGGGSSSAAGPSTVTMPSISSDTIPSTTVASPSSVTASASSTPDLQAGDPFYITVNTPDKRKRALLYVGFDEQGSSILVADRNIAAVFVIDQSGNLRTGVFFIASSTTADGYAALKLTPDPPENPTGPRESCVVSDGGNYTRTILKPLATAPCALPLKGKRGLPYGQVSTLQYYKTPTQVSWAYDYTYRVNDSNNVGPFPPRPDLPLRYYPLVFNDKINLTNWVIGVADSVEKYNTDAIFSFNEPDLNGDSNSANMNVARRSLVGRSNSLTWLSEFMGNATQRNFTISALNMHHYSYPYLPGGLEVFKNYTMAVHAISPGLPVWVTEFGIDGGNLNAPEQVVLDYLNATLDYADATDWIPKIAWFGNYPNNLLNASGTGLSARGQLYSTHTPGLK
ncbi:uncharacterized protein AB675_4556 [Cyphellophora attinorum]|uniref:Asl1-like glycosyl hydrolase catalytic domain-containing protein n=1 Tax=Cyphellophora attinorum TaxID=1664694 RepID=A0A0N0NLE8_9EURO|nr:uncharacterized protein AB675_4556 [Phialophora attinorum]KPI39088.1 hypothetical protein AB675_4556 [Phialophora attinorum]